MIRLFQFKNNFLSESKKKLEAEYSVIGYFDGLDMKTDKEMEVGEKNRILSDPSYAFIEKNPDEMCDYFNIVGLREKDDTKFWEMQEEALVFISCIRFVKKSNNLSKIIENIEKTYNAICFTTLDNSDLIICLRTKSYIKGHEAIENYHMVIQTCDPENNLQKGFSVLAIQQLILDALAQDMILGIKEERLHCVLRGVIKNWSNINVFLVKLKDKLKIKDTEENIERLGIYGLLGSEDITIILREICSIDLFKLYADNGLMTHNNDVYSDAFYNVRTEILRELEIGGII